MSWVETSDFSVILGDSLFQRVKYPLMVDGRSIFTFYRYSETNELAVSFPIRNSAGEIIARVTKNEIEDYDPQLCTVVVQQDRCMMFENERGKRICDIRTNEPKFRQSPGEPLTADLSVALISYGEKGTALILHPDWVRIGKGESRLEGIVVQNFHFFQPAFSFAPGAEGVRLKRMHFRDCKMAVEVNCD